MTRLDATGTFKSPLREELNKLAPRLLELRHSRCLFDEMASAVRYLLSSSSPVTAQWAVSPAPVLRTRRFTYGTGWRTNKCSSRTSFNKRLTNKCSRRRANKCGSLACCFGRWPSISWHCFKITGGLIDYHPVRD